MEYIVVRGTIHNNEFETHVNDMMKQGWRPQGGLVFVPNGLEKRMGWNEMAQAMTRDPNNPEVTYDLLKN